MQTICQYTGLPLEIPHLEISKIKFHFYHPIFTLGIKNLLAIYQQGIDPRKKADCLLFVSACLKATGHVEFETCVDSSSPLFHARILQSCERLVTLLPAIAADKSGNLPTILISKETADLTNLPEWLNLWEETMQENLEASEAEIALRAHKAVERALHTFIQQGKENGAYIKLLCNWLRYAANLPTFSIEHPSRKNWLPISDYWLELLSRAIKDKEVFSLPLNDIKEFYDHLIENLEDVGSIYAYAALSALRKVITAQTQGLGISTAYAFVGSGVTCQPNEAAKAATALVAAIAAKHTDKPQRKDFITNAEYLRASLAWTATQINTKNQKEVEAKADAKALKENE